MRYFRRIDTKEIRIETNENDESGNQAKRPEAASHSSYLAVSLSLPSVKTTASMSILLSDEYYIVS